MSQLTACHSRYKLIPDIYSFQLPEVLPPAYRGKAFRFSYDLVVSINVALPGRGNRQKARDVTVPIRVWSNVSVGQQTRTYDVLHPVIQTKDMGEISEVAPAETTGPSRAHFGDVSKSTRPKEDVLSALKEYAKDLLEPAQSISVSPRPSPVELSDEISALQIDGEPTELKPPTPAAVQPNLAVPRVSPSHTPGIRSRRTSLVDGEADGAEGVPGGCGEAVEVLSRHSPKSESRS